MTNKKPWLYLAAIAALLLLLKYSDALLGGVRLLATLLTPLLLGCAVAYVLNIIVTRIESLPRCATRLPACTGCGGPSASWARWWASR